MLEWLIIGGGLHGTHLSHVLVNALGYPPDSVCVLDSEPEPLAIWKNRTQACGMTHLRSPQVHHLDFRGPDLRDYARETGRADAFIPPYHRPALDLFNDHAAHIIARGGLRRLRRCDTARRIESGAESYRVVSDHRTWHTRRVLLALGQPDPIRPDWGAGLPHVFDTGFERDISAGRYADKHVTVVGAGATGAQLAVKLGESAEQVDLVASTGIHRADFDSPPCYLGPRCLSAFSRATIPRRREILNTVRNIGTVPADVYEQIVSSARIRILKGPVHAISDGALQLEDGRTMPTDELILATGLERKPPGGALVSAAIDRLALPVSPEGWPLLQTDLQWRDGLFVSGRMSELELGPAAANISGARMAGKRLRLWHTQRRINNQAVGLTTLQESRFDQGLPGDDGSCAG